MNAPAKLTGYESLFRELSASDVAKKLYGEDVWISVHRDRNGLDFEKNTNAQFAIECARDYRHATGRVSLYLCTLHIRADGTSEFLDLSPAHDEWAREQEIAEAESIRDTAALQSEFGAGSEKL